MKHKGDYLRIAAIILYKCFFFFFSIDAQHDGTGNSCPANTGFVMEASSGVTSDMAQNLRSWQFSTCSIDYFTAHIATLNALVVLKWTRDISKLNSTSN